MNQIPKTSRQPEFPVQEWILHRWSPRAMSGEPIKDEDLMSIFEAAKWAPSSFNSQPWRFIIAKRDSGEWKTFLDLLVPFNQEWVKNAALMVVIISKNTFDHNGKYSRTHSFDTGAAWMNMALEAHARGFVAHGMSGFDYEKAKEALEVPDEYTIEAMIAIGKPADKSVLSQEMQEKEKPSPRKPLKELIMPGKFIGLK